MQRLERLRVHEWPRWKRYAVALGMLAVIAAGVFIVAAGLVLTGSLIVGLFIGVFILPPRVMAMILIPFYLAILIEGLGPRVWRWLQHQQSNKA